MTVHIENQFQDTIERAKAFNAGQDTFLQAVDEVYNSVKPVLDRNPEYRKHKIFERMMEPERVVSFRVAWQDDDGEIHINRGYRVQMNSALGPYKGGLRFSPSVTLDILKFLAFEQIFKNSLTGLPLGAGKGGANFDPKGKSDSEIMRFCQSLMSELYRHIGHRIDVPAGDIGVGSREIGYLFGAYKKLKNEFAGVLTGKGVKWGGSLIREEATGYGLIIFAQHMLNRLDDSLKGKRCLVSGSGNVAQYAIEKILHYEGVPITVSDTSGTIIDESGIDYEKLKYIKHLKNVERERIKAYKDKFPEAQYIPNHTDSDAKTVWKVKGDCAFPCATQNEVNNQDAQNLVDNGIQLIAEGANMPLTTEAINIVMDAGIPFGPGKASNAGGVAISGLEMMQNRMGIYWTRKQVSKELENIMDTIHDNCLEAAESYSVPGNYVAGANIAGFIKVAESMVAQGYFA